MTRVFLLVLLFVQQIFASESLKGRHIQIDWLAPDSFQSNAKTIVGLRFQPDSHWHVYWKNPGDSGAAPKFQITSTNAQVGPILWPYPTRLSVAHLTNLGYGGETAYLFEIKTNAEGFVQIDVDLEWLVCQEECIPGFGKISLSRPAKNSPSVFKKAIEDKLNFYEQKLPADGNLSPYEIEIKETSNGTVTAIVTSKENLPNILDLFPVQLDYLSPAQPKISKSESNYEVIFQKSATAQKPEKLGFLLLADNKAYEFIDTQIDTQAEPFSFLVLMLLLGSALLGGILLNLMPCVFPVISIKALSLLKTENAQERIRDGVLYTLGVLTTFVSLGAGFLILRHLGSAVGWGFQLQSPIVVLLLILLFWLMALNFIGVFELGNSIMNSTGNIRWQSSFGTGILSVFVAAPCTGPFMGTALGATSTMPDYQAMLVFLFLGIGLALPYLMLTISPALANKMPRPGAWMETLKEFFAFPLFATVLWLIWVLALQTGSQGWMTAGVLLLGISFALWLGKRREKLWKPTAWIFALLIGLYSIYQLQASSSSTKSNWQPYSESSLNAALDKDQPVFIDFTAAWCITCQLNKKIVLETTAADKIFEKAGILRLRADWTKQDPLITQALARLGRNSVPVYAFYSDKKNNPQLLPQILTIEMIENLVPLKEEK